MKNRFLLSALALVVVVNMLVLFGIASNRGGEPDATLLLTERELDYHRGYRDDENSGVSLSLDWNEYSSNDSWFTEQKLEELGFDVEALNANLDDWRYYQRVLPRRGYVVLEYAGAAWLAAQAISQAEIAELKAGVFADKSDFVRRVVQSWESMQSNSRLYAIDVGSDPVALRERYSDRSQYVIVAAEVRAHSSNGDERQVYGTINQLLVERLHVPLALQKPLVTLPQREDRYQTRAESEVERLAILAEDTSAMVSSWQPRYTVKVNWGGRFEPWIEMITLTADGGAVPSESKILPE